MEKLIGCSNSEARKHSQELRGENTEPNLYTEPKTPGQYNFDGIVVYASQPEVISTPEDQRLQRPTVLHNGVTKTIPMMSVKEFQETIQAVNLEAVKRNHYGKV